MCGDLIVTEASSKSQFPCTLFFDHILSFNRRTIINGPRTTIGFLSSPMALCLLFLRLSVSAEASQTLADKYLQEFDKFATQGQKYQAIIWALTELATLIDSAATRYEIEYEIGSHLHNVLNSVDVRDREMKKQFQELQGEVDQLKSDIDKLVNETRSELQASMKKVRKDIISALREIVAQSIDKNRQVAEKVQKKVSKSVGEYKKTTTAQAVSYFIGFQILLILCIYFYSKYMQQIRFS
jgi:DNA anti-recombination protein RmuC